MIFSFFKWHLKKRNNFVLSQELSIAVVTSVK